MNMLIPHRRSGRRRQAPKRFEDEKFVNGNFDQYSRDFSGHKEDKWKSKWQDAENYYHTQNGRKFVSAAWNKESGYRLQLRDFPESLLELTSIWRDFDRELPSDIIDHIGKFLNFTQIDQALLAEDDAFIAGDESEDESFENLLQKVRMARYNQDGGKQDDKSSDSLFNLIDKNILSRS